MKESLRFLMILRLLVVGITFCVFTGGAYALTLKLEPAKAQREVNGKVRVHIYAEGAVNLISMGVTVVFNPEVLQVLSATKNEQNADTGWVMDEDGNAGTTNDEYRAPAVEIKNNAGTVTMIGGNLNGTNTNGFSGKVLLGWIVFNAVGNGSSNLAVVLAREEPFSNFVRVDKTVDEPTNLGALGMICVKAGACYADVDGDNDVDMVDALKFKNASPSSFGAANYNPAADFDGDADVDMVDSLKFKNGSPRSNCPGCP